MGRRFIAGLAAIGLALGACTSGSPDDDRESVRSTGATGTSLASVVIPPTSNAYGRSIVQWQESWIRWAFTTPGDENPLLNPTQCGEIVEGVFFLTAAIESGLEADCMIPVGMPILVPAAGTMGVQGLHAKTPEQLLGGVQAKLDTLEFARLSIDGFNVPLSGVLRFTSTYHAHFRRGNYFDQVGSPVHGNRLVASGGIFVRLRPLSAGEHTIMTADRFSSADILDITFHMTVSA